MIGFLPVIHRKLQRNGLYFERIRYWADVLPAIAQPREPLLIRYDPRDLSKLYVLGPHHLMSASHVGASDRDADSPLQQRQASYLRRAAPAARTWLANQQRQWPTEYRRRCWITDPSLDNSRYDPHPPVMH